MGAQVITRLRDHADECALWALMVPAAVALATTCTGGTRALCVFVAGFAAGALLRALHGGAL